MQHQRYEKVHISSLEWYDKFLFTPFDKSHYLVHNVTSDGLFYFQEGYDIQDDDFTTQEEVYKLIN